MACGFLLAFRLRRHLRFERRDALASRKEGRKEGWKEGRREGKEGGRKGGSGGGRKEEKGRKGERLEERGIRQRHELWPRVICRVPNFPRGR